jgi:hypothetical protein
MKSEDKLYTKVVVLEEIYNFVFDDYFIWNYFKAYKFGLKFS